MKYIANYSYQVAGISDYFQLMTAIGVVINREGYTCVTNKPRNLPWKLQGLPDLT